MSFPVVVPCIDLMSTISSVTRKLESIPQMKMASCAGSVMSVLSSTAKEYAIKSMLLLLNCARKLADILQTRSAIVFPLRFTFTNIGLLSGDKTSQTLIMHFFRNSPSVKGRDDLATFPATIKLALQQLHLILLW